METVVIILIIAAVIGLAVYLVRQKQIKKAGQFKTIETRVYAITDKRKMPSGLNIWVEAGAAIVPPEVDAIERGLKECFERAKKAGYDRPLNLSDYIVAIVGDCIRSPEGKIWSYKLPAGPYAGTSWDLGGFILAAGQMIAAGEPFGNIIVLPEHKGTDFDQLSTIAGYEAEHIILCWCDGDKFEATKVHGTNAGHPLF